MKLNTPIKNKKNSKKVNKLYKKVAVHANLIDSLDCQKQSDDYKNAYNRWQKRPKNKYSFHFSQNDKEHLYIDGLGFAHNSPLLAERQALSKNLFLVGIAILLSFVVEYFGKYFSCALLRAFGIEATWSISGGFGETPQAIIFSINMVTQILQILVPIVTMVIVTKLPKQVWFPQAISSIRMHKMSIPVAICLFVVQSFLMRILTFTIDLLGMDTMFVANSPDNTILWLLGILGDVIIVSIVDEILFRGIILQIFRQFGNGFAIVLTSFVSALITHDLFKGGFAFVYSIVISYFVICTGSIWTGILMRLIMRLLFYVQLLFSQGITQNFISPFTDNASKIPVFPAEINGVLWNIFLLVCGIIGICLALFCFKRGNCFDDLELKPTNLSMTDKILHTIFSPVIIILEIVVIILILLSFQIIF